MLTIDCRTTPAFRRVQDNPELYLKTLQLQNELREAGFAWHNPFSDECTGDFSCCEQTGPDSLVRFPSTRAIQEDVLTAFADYMDLRPADVDRFISFYL